MPQPTIIALGGGGFYRDPKSPLDDFIVQSTGREEPAICFLPTASGDSSDYISAFYTAYIPRRCRPSHVTLFNRYLDDLRAHLLAQDAIFVGGGNTANMLAVWRLHGVDKILREAWEAGVVMSGVSAGMNCWFEACTTDSYRMFTVAELNDGLGFISGGASPHYDGEPGRRPGLHKFVAGGFPTTHAADDGAGLVFEGTELREVITVRPEGQGYLVEKKGDQVVETPIAARLLS